MLFWVFVLMLTAGVACFVMYNKTDVGEWCFNTGAGLISISVVALFICFIFLGIGYIGLDGEVAANHERYETLIYQYENDIYENDNDLGKRDLIKDIQEWNEDLARYQKIQDDFWIGIFIPNVFDQFKFIELDKGGTE